MPNTVSYLYPSFVAGQTLRADDLNKLLDFVIQQDRETRVFLIGSGILYGLSITTTVPDATKPEERLVVVGKGAGVSSAGVLFAFEEPTAFSLLSTASTGFDLSGLAKPDATDKTASGPVHEFGLPAEASLAAPITVADGAAFEQLCFVLYFKETTSAGESTSCFDTFNKTGKLTDGKVRLLAMTQTDLDKIWNGQPAGPAAPTSPAASFPYIERLRLAGEQIKFNNWSEVKARYSQICHAAIDTTLLDKLRGPVPELQIDALKIRLTGLLQNDPIQHLYDYLKTLAAAHAEWADACPKPPGEAFWCPDTDEFSNFVVPGSIGGGCRMGWFRPGMESGAAEDFYKKRLALMADGDKIHFPDQPNLTRITGSKARTTLLSEQAIPFLFHNHLDELRLCWNECLTKTGRWPKIPFYSVANGNPPNDQPLNFDMDAFDFFRVEGHLGKPLPAALAEIRALRSDLSLPFQILLLGFQKPGFATLLDEPVADLTFDEFAKKYPGMEHLGGVPKGGTLILVFDSGHPGTAATLVGDFCLPYRWCPPVQKVKPVAEFAEIARSYHSEVNKPDNAKDDQTFVDITFKNLTTGDADQFLWDVTATKGKLTAINITKPDRANLVLDGKTLDLKLVQQIKVKLTATCTPTGDTDSTEATFNLCPTDVSLGIFDKQTEAFATSTTIELTPNDKGFIGPIPLEAVPTGGIWRLLGDANSNGVNLKFHQFAHVEADNLLAVTGMVDAQGNVLPLPVGEYAVTHEFIGCDNSRRQVNLNIVQQGFVVEFHEGVVAPVAVAAPVAPPVAAAAPRSLGAALNRRRSEWPLNVQAVGQADAKAAALASFKRTSLFVSSPPTAADELHAKFGELASLLVSSIGKKGGASDETFAALLGNLLGCYLDRVAFDSPGQLPHQTASALSALKEKLAKAGQPAAPLFAIWNGGELGNPAFEAAVAAQIL